MKNIKAITVFTLLIFNSLISYQQSVLDRFVWTDKKEYLCVVETKEQAIGLCARVMDLYYTGLTDLEIYEDSKVPVFWARKHPEKKNKAIVIYCIAYKDEYDVVFKEIKDKETYFFTFDDYDGTTYELHYRKR